MNVGEGKRIAEAFIVALVSAFGTALANWAVESIKDRRRAATEARTESERWRDHLRAP